MFLPSSLRGRRRSLPSSAADDVVLQLCVSKRRSLVGDPVNVRFEIWNRSGHDLYLCRSFSVNGNAPCNVEIRIQDKNGKGSIWQTAGEPAVRGFPQEVSEALSKWFVVLPSSYSYGSNVNIDDAMSPSIKTPGRYKITATYTSQRLRDSLAWFNPAFANSEEAAKLSDQQWHGEVEAVPLWIEITDRR